MEVQAGAKAAIVVGMNHPEMLTLAGIWNYGQHPSHCNRALVQAFKLAGAMAPPVDMVKVPVLIKDKQVIWEPCYVQFPHRVFAFWSQGGDTQKWEQIYRSPDAIVGWWEGVHEDDPKLAHHLVKEVQILRAQMYLRENPLGSCCHEYQTFLPRNLLLLLLRPGPSSGNPITFWRHGQGLLLQA